MFLYTGLAEFDMTKVTVALCYSGLTKVTPDHVLGNSIKAKKLNFTMHLL